MLTLIGFDWLIITGGSMMKNDGHCLSIPSKVLFFAIAWLVLTSGYTVCADNSTKMVDVVILGLGGRGHGLLFECLKLQEAVHKSIRVVGVADNNAQASLDFYVSSLDSYIDRVGLQSRLCARDYRGLFDGATFYPDTDDGLKQLFERHHNVDYILITSSNDRHLPHLNAALTWSTCRNIFIEKPIFRNLSEFSSFHGNIDNRAIYVGLTLRYTTMTKIAHQKLIEFKEALGRVKKVTSWERVPFAHAVTIIMMNWRRYKSISGGLLLEKSVHDLDLALFFMQALSVHPEFVAITTETAHNFFKLSRKDEIKDRIIHDETVRNSLKRWFVIPWQRVIDFSHDALGNVDWEATVEAFFKEFPHDDLLPQSDIIPDFHTLNAQIITGDNNTIDFELAVQLNGFAPVAERGTQLICDHGTVTIDIQQGSMVLAMNDGVIHEFNLHETHEVHAGGDRSIAYLLLGALPEGQHKAAFNDPAVQLSTIMGMVSEEQARSRSNDVTTLVKKNDQWIVMTNVCH